MLKLKIDNMSCNHCIAAITKTIKALDPSAEVNVDLATHTATINSKLDEQEILIALEEEGYAATTFTCCCANNSNRSKV